jgi:O-antigen ligase
MHNQATEKFVARIFLFALPLATIFILIDQVSDPVNVTKFFSVGLLAFGCAGLLVANGLISKSSTARAFVISILIFLIVLLIPLFFSGAPFTQSLYGGYGRNTGVITYFALVCLALTPLLIGKRSSFQQLLWGLQIAGGINVIYSAWVLAFGDPLKWNNNYGTILGFFGNPDFISAFLGMFVTAVLSAIVVNESDWRLRVIGLAAVALALFEIYKSHAQQGFVVTAIGIGFIGFNLIRSNANRRGLTTAYVIFVGLIGVVAVLGSLNHGPLSLFHKQSIIFREWYWHAAITMGLAHPLTGVGLDNYGDWYRRSRSLEATTSQFGPDKITDAAHSVVLDMFASGGFPLLISYLVILAVAIRSMVRVLQRSKSYDAVFVGIAGVWIAYQAQSLISLNQIGLAAWGWVFSGALVAYEVSTRSDEDGSQPSKKSQSSKMNRTISPLTPFLLGAAIGLVIVLPPFLSNTEWKSALNTRDISKVERTLEKNYFAPPNTYKYYYTLSIYDSNGFFDKAHDLNLKALAFNPDSFTLWKALYLRENSSPAEKAQALKNLHRLDPNNPTVDGK